MDLNGDNFIVFNRHHLTQVLEVQFLSDVEEGHPRNSTPSDNITVLFHLLTKSTCIKHH